MTKTPIATIQMARLRVCAGAVSMETVACALKSMNAMTQSILPTATRRRTALIKSTPTCASATMVTLAMEAR